MKLEDIENAWSSQSASVALLDFATLQRATLPELRRRTRFLRYALGAALFAVVAYPLLSLANYLYYKPANALLFWGNVAVHLGFWLVLLVFTLRRLRGHHALLRQSAISVRAYATASLEATVAEMRENREAFALVPALLALAVWSRYANHPADYTMRTLAFQLLSMAAILLPVLLAVWRHHRRHLAPRKAQLQALLAELKE